MTLIVEYVYDKEDICQCALKQSTATLGLSNMLLLPMPDILGQHIYLKRKMNFF
jgi:hypothetical protein